jgi:hypothetical protein
MKSIVSLYVIRSGGVSTVRISGIGNERFMMSNRELLRLHNAKRKSDVAVVAAAAVVANHVHAQEC